MARTISVKVDEETKSRMETFSDINWADVIRAAIRRRLEIEEDVRRPINKARAIKASKHMLKIKSKTSGKWSGVEEIRKWRERRSQS
ncbi:MAG: hypothetical protein ACRD38_10710 [Nitrososphaerales archaeon]